LIILQEKNMSIQNKDWHAWLNTMPPKPDDFHVTGEVIVANPGITAQLTKRSLQGVNPAILLLDLHLVQQAGNWPQVQTCYQARYDQVIAPRTPAYTAVQIFAGNEEIAKIDSIDIVS
jgi:hypothetical protein